MLFGMASSGWYPDPEGSPGRYRYWDGETWSTQTTASPQNTPPPTGNDQPGDGRRSERGWIVALVVLALVTTLVVGGLVWATGGVPGTGGHATEDTNSSTPTVSAWDETSTPSYTPPPLPTDNGGIWVDCPWSSGYGHTTQQAGRMTAAGLSAAIPSGYGSGHLSDFEMAYDFHGVGRDIGSTGYFSSIGVGLISFADGFTQLTITANQVMQCWAMTNHPRDNDPEVLIAGEQIDISGHAAWHIRWHIIYKKDKPIPGEILDVIVVDMGHQADYFGVYISCRPYGFADYESSIASAIASLRVS